MGCAASTAVTSAQQPQLAAQQPAAPKPTYVVDVQAAPDLAASNPAATQQGRHARATEQAVSVAQSVAVCGLDAVGAQAQEVAKDVAARAGSIQGLSDVNEVLSGSIEAHIEAAAQTRDRWMAGIGESSDDLARDADVVLESVEKVVGLVLNANSKDAEPVDIQSLELRKRSPLEQGFAKYSALGQVGEGCLWLRFSPSHSSQAPKIISYVLHLSAQPTHPHHPGLFHGSEPQQCTVRLQLCREEAQGVPAPTVQVLIDIALPAMEAMPFGAPAAAVIGAVYARAAQAS